MITDNEKFIEIQGILSLSDISPNDCIKIDNLIIELSKENQELKKQLEEINKVIEKCGFANIEQVILNYCGLLIQQKEFIKYLEDEINKLVKEYGNYVYDDYSEEKGKYDSYQEILQKYRSIIGCDKVE